MCREIEHLYHEESRAEAAERAKPTVKQTTEKGNHDVLSVRLLTVKDVAKLLDFYLTLSQGVTAFYQPFGPAVTEETIDKHLKETDAGKHMSFGLVGEDGRIEGHSFILFIDTPRPVFGIGLQERLHGMGWGRTMMEVVLREGDTRKLPLVTLTVVKRNTKAKALYEKLGFVLKGEATFKEKDDSLYMERTLLASLTR